MTEEIKTAFDEPAKKETQTVVKPRPFVMWKVNGEVHKLKLTTATIVRLEESFGKPLLDAVINGEGGIPPYTTTISILQGALQKFNHSVKSSDVEAMIDDYIAGGKTYMDLMSDVIYPLMYDAGFFTKAMLDGIRREIKNADTVL